MPPRACGVAFSFANKIFDVKSAAIAPMIWPAKNPSTLAGLTPAKLSDSMRATVMAGLAKLVEDVHQYPAVIAKATVMGTDLGA